MLTKKEGTRFVSLLLALTMVISMLMVSPNYGKAAAAATAMANDCVTVKIDNGAAQALKSYCNGVYEIGVTLTAGSHNYTVSSNSNSIAAQSISASSNQAVYIRYYAKGSTDEKAKNGVVDSVNNANHFKTAATWVGNFKGLEKLKIANWNPADTNGNLNYMGGGIYCKTFKFDALAADVTMGDGGYKVAFNNDSSWAAGSMGKNGGNDNIPLTIPKGSTQVTIYADTLNKVCTDSVNTPQMSVYQNSGTIKKPAFATSLSLIGTARCASDSENWAPAKTGYEFTQISPTLYAYCKMFQSGNYQYKGVFDYTNWYESFGGGNKKLAITADNTNVVILYDVTTDKFYDTVNDYDKAAELLGFAAAPVIPAEAKVTNNINGTTNFIMSGKKSDTVLLTYASKSDPTKATTVPMTFDKNGFTSGDLYLGDSALDIIYYYTVNGTRTLNLNADKVTVGSQDYSAYTRAKFTGRLVNVPGSLPGKSWDPASNVMTYQGNGLYSYTFKAVPAAKYEYKIAMGTWDENYGVNGTTGSNNNYGLSVSTQQDVTIYYSDFSHRSVSSINYSFADLTLAGAGIAGGTKLTDAGLTGIFSAAVPLKAGNYNDLKIIWANKTGGAVTYDVKAFTLAADKNVTFYFDPSTELFYCNASDVKIDGTKIKYNTQDTNCKSTYGAIEEGKNVTFRIQTGNDVTDAAMIVKGPKNEKIPMTSTVVNGETIWSATTNFAAYGEYTYFFALSSATDVKIYGDDDGYYGTGVATDLSRYMPYDLVVYKSGYKTPDWMKNSVIYQIFPDRFHNGNPANDKAQSTSRGAINYETPSSWYKWPENPEQETKNPTTYPSQAMKGDGIWSNEIYGGDLAGVTQRIDYLKALGVNVIYLNPVFSSISSHRYDTTDYSKIDPILGTLGDFKQLVETAKKNNMHIVLDGVFNHVSDDSIYFDRYYKFVGKNGKVGAYPYWAYVYDYMAANTGATQSDAEAASKAYFKTKGVTDFSYTQWFTVANSALNDKDTGKAVSDTIGDRKGKAVYGYDGWWGYDSMPVITATNGSEYQTGNWSSEIISGPNSVTQYWLSQGSNGWRLDVANEVSDETWKHFRESAKSLSSDNVIIGEIWDDATKYLLGDMYDSVMNYQFRNDVLAYATGGKASNATKALEKIREKYPKEAFYAMMNLVDSHDTTRLLSYLDGIQDDRKQKDTASAFPTYATTSATAKARQYMVALIQMTYAGVPTIYYGDELGMVGADDPDNRRAMEWGKGNKDLVEWYAKLTAIRSEYSALRTGSIIPLETGNDAVMAYQRSDDDAQLIVATNNSGKAVTVTLNANPGTEYTDLISNNKVISQNSQITVSVPAYSGVIYTNKVKAITINTNALKPAYDSSYIVNNNGSDHNNPPADGYVANQNIVNSNGKVTVDLTKGSTKLSAAQMSLLIALNKTEPVILNGENYSITFAANTMKAVTGQTDYDFGVAFNSGANLSIIKQLFGDSFVLMISYNHSGPLPAEATIHIKVGTQYAGKTLYYYYFNPQPGKPELIQEAVVGQDGYITVKQSHCSEYVLSTTNLSKDTGSNNPGSNNPGNNNTGAQNPSSSNKTIHNPKTGDNLIFPYVFSFLCFVLALAVLTTRTRKKEIGQ